MKTTPPTATAMALAALYAKDKTWVEQSFQHLTPNALRGIEERLQAQHTQLQGVNTREARENDTTSSSDTASIQERDWHVAIAQACIRRMAYRCLDKYAQLPDPQEVEEALKYYTLPAALHQELANKYGNVGDNNAPPTTWYQALEQLKQLATTDNDKNNTEDSWNAGDLWRLVLDHPMTAYVPVQCPSCGHVVPDEYPPSQADVAVGLQELPPMGSELGLRAGWFRGPRGAVVFQLTCTACRHVSQWYRSGHARMLLNPHRWGRLCGEQEDLRLALAQYLHIPVRLVIPLDWDHVWSEYQSNNNTAEDPSSCTTTVQWQVQDDSARNFACRLDEGIGSWTRVWALHPDPAWCQDVTQAYLTCQQEGGRADDLHEAAMPRHCATVERARQDASGQTTQAKTLQGHVVARSKMSDEEITWELQRAAREYGTGKEWWQLF